MRIIDENNLCENRPYVNLKKLSIKTTVRVPAIDAVGFKGTYIIDQYRQCLCTNENYTSEYSKGIEKNTYYTEELNKMLFLEINCSANNDSSAKFKAYAVLDNIKYVLPYTHFEDIYKSCMDILVKEVSDKDELEYIKKAFGNLKVENISVDIDLNLKRLADFKDKVDYKRNVRYFVINNVAASISKYDINSKSNKINVTDNVKVLRHNYRTRLYDFVTANNNVIELKPTDIICNLGDENTFPTVHIYTEYGMGLILDINNNVIPTTNTLSLFANLLDLGLDVLG